MGNTVPRVCKPVKVVCIAASSLELGAIGNAAPMKTDVVFRTHQEVGFRSLNAVAELTLASRRTSLGCCSKRPLTRPPRWSINMRHSASEVIRGGRAS